MDFNNFYTSGNGNECPLQVSYLLIYFTCDVNMTWLSRPWHWWAAAAFVHAWQGLEQSLIDDTVDQLPTCLHASVVPMVDFWTYFVTVNLFSLYFINFMFHTMLAKIRVHYKSMKCDVIFSQGSISTLFMWGKQVFHDVQNVLPAYSSAKIIKNQTSFPELWSQMYKCTATFFMNHSV